MHESWQTNYNEIKEDVERFEQMENGEKEYYFDVHSIENIFDFYADKNQFEKAERVLQLGFRQHPQSTTLLAKQAIILIEKGEDQRAIDLMEGILHLEKSNPEFYLNLGWVYLRNGLVDKGIVCFRKTLEMAFDEHEEYLLDIVLYLNQVQEFKSTIHFLESGIKQYPANENLLFELAFALDKEERIDEGLQVYHQLLEVNPFSENAWYNLGILYIKNKQLDEAVSCYDYALALNPSHAEALFNKGNALVHLNQYLDALDCYLDYISYGYEPLLAYHYMADCHEQLGFNDLARRMFSLTVKSDPEYIPGWLGYLSLLINHEYNEEALEETHKALELFASYSEFHYLRARALLLIDDYKGAQKEFETGFKIDPDNLRNTFELFQIKSGASRQATGLPLWKRWKGKYPDSPAIQYLGAAVYLLEIHNPEQAAICLDKALSNDTESYDLFIELYPELEEVIQNNPILNQIILKYFDYEL